MSNIPESIHTKRTRKLHLVPNHPIEIIKKLILTELVTSPETFVSDTLPEEVTVQCNFDDLLTPLDHPSRSRSDTYYVDETTVLRSHMTAHQTTLLKDNDSYVIVGDVYRKDECDSRHAPVFHQIDGAKLFPGSTTDEELVADLHTTLDRVITKLFPGCSYRWSEDKFPFVYSGEQVDVEYQRRDLEILGAGLIRPEILAACGKGDRKGWAFGMGLDRLAMILFNIPDIRLLWSTDVRFLGQFEGGNIVTFKPYPVVEAIECDVSFFIPANQVVDGKWSLLNDFCEVVREVAGDAISEVKLLDQFVHPTKGHSHTFRLTYQCLDTEEKNHSRHREMTLVQHRRVVDEIGSTFNVVIR